MLRRAFHVIAAHTRDMQMEKNLYRIRYVIPLLNDKVGTLESIEMKTGTHGEKPEIVLTFANNEITQFIEPPEKYHYKS